ncbi:MAG: hypothetical protein C5B54_06205 [Acidobacteria bacterium]|nr:MAG: hypothetical protein C5B54_06205 [Acidobacteriota bacterium]
MDTFLIINFGTTTVIKLAKVSFSHILSIHGFVYSLPRLDLLRFHFRGHCSILCKIHEFRELYIVVLQMRTVSRLLTRHGTWS